MAKIKHKIILDPVFRSETLFYQCKDGEQAMAHARKKYNVSLAAGGFDGYNGTCVELVCKKTEITAWMIWVADKKDWKTMTHEAAHLVFKILDCRGVKYSSNNDETWCYLQGFFIAEFWHIMCKK